MQTEEFDTNIDFQSPEKDNNCCSFSPKLNPDTITKSELLRKHPMVKKSHSMIVTNTSSFLQNNPDILNDYRFESIPQEMNMFSLQMKEDLQILRSASMLENEPKFETKNIVVFETTSPSVSFYYESGGLRFEGEVVGGNPHGEGTFYYENGKKAYEGEWLNGERDGSGTLYSKETGNIIYHGNWIKNEQDCMGTLYNAKGQKIYNGYFSKGRRFHFGTSYYPETGNITYEGEWRDDKPFGNGKQYFDNPEKVCYEGGWRGDKWHGSGKNWDQKGNIVNQGRINYGVWENNTKRDGHVVNCLIM